MKSEKSKTKVALALACVSLLSNAALRAADSYPAPPPWQPDPGQREHLRRSLTLLSASTPADRKTVRILFYGQSITQQAWWKEIERYLRATYTNANLIIENRAIGGHAAQLLVKTAEADLYPFQPDLLIFHVYGSHLEYENIIRRVRERTCADILLQTDHLTSDASLTEETDPAKLSPAKWDPWMNHVFLPATASKYGACRADIHELWKAYLQTHQLKAANLLRDGVHLNAQGEWLMAELLKAYLAPLPPIAGYDPLNEPGVRTVLLPRSTGRESVRFEFTGTRADLLFKPNAKGSIAVLVDGKQPSAIPELYGFTRVSAFPMSDWPVLLRVSAVAPLVAEDWSLKIDQASPDGKLCHFNLRGSVTGEDGDGSSTNRFVSKSGRVVIEPDDWNLAFSVAVFKRPLPENYTATWRAILRGTDIATPPATSRGTEQCVTLAQGLSPGRHVVELRGADLAKQIQATRFYCPPGESGKIAGIQEIDLVHFSHTDVGFTDSPSVCRELYRRYLDIALDAILDSMKGPTDKRFYWTAESTLAVNDWWQAATPDRRKQFLKAVRAGQLEVTALACNNTPFMNAVQWQTMVHWLPEDLWREVRPSSAVQNDVNGVPRAAAIALLDRGVRHLFTGINEDSGGVPFPRPSAFWWKMPDGRRLFVWLNIGYGSGFDFFEPAEWRRGPVPRAADTTYRPPRAGDILRSDEASVRAAHKLCVERLRQLENSGYKHELLTISITSQWRFDNDPPFPPLAEFVSAWNRLKLQPRLRLTTVADAMARMEKVMGPTASEYRGEWTDWWANGTGSAPRAVAASRAAKRFLAAAQSPLWGPVDARTLRTMDDLYRDLCLFDEHTWGSSLSVAKPYSLDTQAQFTEKSILAYRPMARAEWLLSQRARTRLLPKGEGFYLANPAQAPFSGWVRMIATCLRDNYQTVEDPETGARMKLYFEPGIQPWGRPQKPEDLSREDISATFPDRAPNQVAKFWVDKLEGNTIRRLHLSTERMETEKPSDTTAPEIKTDSQGWPISALWPGMKRSLFIDGLGDFIAVEVNGFAPRHGLADIRSRRGQERERLRQEKLKEIAASAEAKATVQETPHTLVFTQSLRHPRLQWATRVVELWKREPRARLTLRLNRLSSAAPEIFYLAFPLPTGDVLPRLSSGGQPFTPFTDQLPGTCRDYFAIDSWADYSTPEGHWLWVSRDAPLMTLGSSPTLALRQAPPKDPHRLLAMIFNNFWYTNFAADEHGIMEFQFDLVWRQNAEGRVPDLAEALAVEPVTLINPGAQEDPRVLKNLFQP